MSVRKIKFTGDVYLRGIEGAGDSLRLRVEIHRTTRTGTAELYELNLMMYRTAVKHLLSELRDMHHRDQQRLAREAQRIEDEKAILTHGEM